VYQGFVCGVKLNLLLFRSEMAQKVGANGLAENVMAFNTNYNDAGLFGVFATAKVRTSAVI
jgi:predicted Zn-dependent peptidase